MPPANDNDFAAYGADAYEIACRPGTVTVHDSNVDATKQVGEPDFDGTVGGHSVWWWWSSPGNGSVTVSVNPDYVNGTPLTDPLLLIYDCDDFCDYDHPVAEGHGSVTFTAKQGIDYVVGVDGVAGEEGDFALTVVRPTSPANDLFALAEELVGDSGSTSGSTNWACTEFDDDPRGFFNVWYKWTPGADGWAKLTQTLTDALHSPGGREVAVYTGGPGAWIPIIVRSAAGAADVAAASAWDIYFEVTAGETYYVIVSGEGDGLDRFDLDWFAPMDLADDEPADVVVGPAVSSTTTTINDPTPGGEWFRFEFEWESGDLPVTDYGLVEFKNADGVIVGQIRLFVDVLQARGSGSGSWTSLGKPATIGPGLSKVRVEAFYFPNGPDLKGRFRVNGVPAGPTVSTSLSWLPTTVRRGCLWNTAADPVEVRIENVGIRVDPDLGPWYSTDPDDKGVTFLWGGEGGEFGLSSGGANWITQSGSTTNVPDVIPAPGVGASPAGRYGYALDFSTTTAEQRAVAISAFGFSQKAAGSFYFIVGDYPDAACPFARITATVLGQNSVELVLGPTGIVQVRHGGVGFGASTLRRVSLDRWHHIEVFVDFLSPGWPTFVRLNGVLSGPFYKREITGERLETDPFVPDDLMLGVAGIGGAANFEIAGKDIVVYRDTAFPLGGQKIRKRVPSGVGSHDANVDEWVAGANQQTPITDGDDRFDYSADTIGTAPANWLHNLHFANPSSISVELASGSPPAAMAGARVIRYTPNAPPRSGAYVLVPPPAFSNNKRYLIEAWIKKVAGKDGQWDSWAGLVELQAWPWPTGTGGWFRFSQERLQIGGSCNQFGFNNNNTSGPNEIGPITIWEDFVYEPRATGFWQSDDDGATYTSIQDSDATSHEKIQEWPPATGGSVVGVGPATTGWVGDPSPAGNSEHFLEYALQDDGPVGAPILAARLYARGRGYDWRNRTVDPTDASIIYPSRASEESGDHGAPVLFAQGVSGSGRRWLPPLALSRGGGDAGHDSYMLPVAPGDAAWTVAAWNAWRARFGYPVPADPDDITAEPVVEAFAVELLAPEPELPPEGGGPLLELSFRAERSSATPAALDDESADVHLSGIDFRT